MHSHGSMLAILNICNAGRLLPPCHRFGTMGVAAQICTFKTLRVSLVNHQSQLHFPQLHILKPLPRLSQQLFDIVLCILAAI